MAKKNSTLVIELAWGTEEITFICIISTRCNHIYLIDLTPRHVFLLRFHSLLCFFTQGSVRGSVLVEEVSGPRRLLNASRVGYLLAGLSDSQLSWSDGILIFSLSASIDLFSEEPLGAWQQ